MSRLIIVRTLDELYASLGERKLTLCRELTKKFEEIMPTTLQNARAIFETQEPRENMCL